MRFPNENWDYQQDYFKNEHLSIFNFFSFF